MDFKYRALDANGQMLSGAIAAGSESEAISLIRGRNQRLIQLMAEQPKAQDVELPFLKPKVKLVDLTMFCKQLSTMLGAGVPVNRALDIQIAQTVNKKLKSTLTKVSSSIKQGMPLSKAMRQFPEDFPPLMLNMVEAGELTGKLDEVLARLYTNYSKENAINKKVHGAMIYPMVLGFLTIAVMILMLTVVLPMFADMFSSSGGALPLPTRIMIGISDSLRGYWYIYIAVIASAVFLFKWYVKTTGGRYLFDKIKLSAPVVSGLIKEIITARFTRTLSTLLGSGISIIKALESATEITNNAVVTESMISVINDVKKGQSVSSLLKRVPVFPPMMLSMVSVGEETGAVDDMLEKTADYYDEELESAISKLVALLEPAMIVFMGIGIGAIVIAMYLPMFSMSQAMNLG